MVDQVQESQFYMWRTLFALAHVDHIVTSEEIRFMVEALEDVPFSDYQQEILKKDIDQAQDALKMYIHISNPKDQAEFFNFAREMVWADGHYGPEEREIMLKLKEIHVRDVNVDELVGDINLELDDNYEPLERDVKKTILAFKENFLKTRFNA